MCACGHLHVGVDLPHFSTWPCCSNRCCSNPLSPPHTITRLISETWLFLETECVEEVMGNLAHLIPSRPVRELLLDDPSWLLRAQRGQRWLGEHPDTTMESMYWSND